MKNVWYQAHFYSKLGNCWVPLGGQAETEAGAREVYAQITGIHQRRIVKITYMTEVIESEDR